jgi:trigger factor
MKVDTNKLAKNQVELTIEVSLFELQPFLINASAKISKEMNVPGFRPGKVPYDIVKDKIGEQAIYEEALEQIIKKTYPQAVLDNNLETVGQPKISVLKIAPGNPVVYKAQVSLLPKIQIGEYKKIKAKKKEVKIDPKEIDKAIANLQKMFGKEMLVERPAQKGDKVEIDFDVFVDKVPIDGGGSKQHPLVIGEGNFIPGFEENLIGLAKEQVKEFKLNFPKNYHKKDLSGKLAEFKVKMRAVYKIELPPLDDNLAKQVGQFKTFEEMGQKIEESIRKESESKEEQRFELEIIDEIIKKSKFEEIPDILIEAEKDKTLAELEQDIQRQGMKFEDYLQSLKKSKDELRKGFLEPAEKRIKTALVLRHIAKEEKIKVEDKEIDQEIKKTLETYKNDPEIKKQVELPEYRYYLANVLTSQKTMEFLKSFAR